MSYQIAQRDQQSVIMQQGSARISIEIVTPNVLRVRKTLEETFSTRQSLMMLPREVSNVPWSLSEDDTTITVSTALLSLRMDRASGALSWYDVNGALLVREPVTPYLERVPIEVSVFDEQTHLVNVDSVDGARRKASNVAKRLDRYGYTVKHELEFSEGEALYGLGQHEEGILNYRGHHQYLYQHNMKIAVPMLVSTRGYGLLWDTYALSVFHDDEVGSYFWTEYVDELDYYFMAGPEFDSIIKAYRELTGESVMLPKWAYGYVQSKERYNTQDELVEIVDGYRERNIPLDCIVQDWHTWPEGLWGQKTVDPERYYDLDKLSADLHARNAHWMISIWPNMRGDGPNQQAMRERGFLLGNDSTYDAFNPAARLLYWQHANEGLFQHGLDAWWCDCTEPFEADWHGEIKPEPWKRVTVNSDEAKTYFDPAYINAFTLLHAQGIYEGQRSVTEDKRVVNLTRSYFPGQQRYGTITWSGDISATWDVLRKQIADGLNFTVTGCPKWTLDIGAFFIKPQTHGALNRWFWAGDYPDGVDDPGYRELYLRWFQLGTFLPMFRSHGTDTPREVWRFGEPGDVIYDTLVDFDYLRYRLMPYIYSLAGWETHLNYTTLRNLAFDFRADPQVYDIADQFMFGPALMVCPVTEPMHYGPNGAVLKDVPQTREVYLPAGVDWYDFWTGTRYSGGQTVTAAAPLERMPLFVRAGSILPLGPKVQYADALPDAPWELRIYPGADGSFDIYEDDGDGYAYEQGAFAWTSLVWDDHAGTLRVGQRKGSFENLITEREFNVIRVSENHGVGLEPESTPDMTVTYSGESAETTIVKE